MLASILHRNLQISHLDDLGEFTYPQYLFYTYSRAYMDIKEQKPVLYSDEFIEGMKAINKM